MAPIFILTRAFVISAFLVGVLPTVLSAPVPLRPRFMGACYRGCLIADPTELSATIPSATPAVSSVQSTVPTIIEIIQAASPPPPPTVSQLVPTTDGEEDESDLPNALLRFGTDATPSSNVETEPLAEITNPTPSVVEVIDLDVPPPTASQDSVVDKLLEALPELVSTEIPPAT